MDAISKVDALSFEQPETTACYKAALELTKLGISVIPIAVGTKEPPRGFRWGEYTTRIADASEIYTWFEVEGHQLAVICGPISGNLVVIDFDRKADADGGYTAWALQHAAIRDLPRLKTGKGRVHVYCRSDQLTDKYTIGDAGDKIEVRSGNHYCVAPPSIHPETGTPYIWSQLRSLADGVPTISLSSIGFEPRRREVPALGEPGTEGNPLAPSDISNIVEITQPSWREGQRHDLCLSLSGWLAGYSVPESDARAIVEMLAHDEPRDGLRKALGAVRDTYTKWRAGIAVAGWSVLTDSASPLISRAQATRLELIVKGRQASIVFDLGAAKRIETPWIQPASELAATEFGEEVWLVNGLLRAGTLNIVVGPPKTYKSFLVLDMAIAVATGTPMLGGFHVAEPRPVIYIQEESGRRYVRDRIVGLARGRGVHPAALDNLFVITNQRFRLDDEKHMLRLAEEAIERYGAALVIYDPLRELHWADENKSETMKPILDGLKGLRDGYDSAHVVVHHNNKNPLYTSPAESIRGSTSIWAAMDGGIFLSTTDNERMMKTQVVLKEGAGVDPFLYGIESDPEGIRAKLVELDTAAGRPKFDALQVVRWARELDRWWGIDDVIDAFPLSDRTVRDAVRNLVNQQYLRERPAKQNKKEYSHPEVLDDATF